MTAGIDSGWEAASFSLKIDFFGRVVLCCFAFLSCCPPSLEVIVHAMNYKDMLGSMTKEIFGA